MALFSSTLKMLYCAKAWGRTGMKCLRYWRGRKPFQKSNAVFTVLPWCSYLSVASKKWHMADSLGSFVPLPVHVKQKKYSVNFHKAAKGTWLLFRAVVRCILFAAWLRLKCIRQVRHIPSIVFSSWEMFEIRSYLYSKFCHLSTSQTALCCFCSSY